MFEIHLTTTAILETNIPKFVEYCRQIQVKPIVIELEEGQTAQQPMISKVLSNVDAAQLHEVIDNLKARLEDGGYPIVRTKVEVPLDYIELGEEAFPNYKGRYFEWHGKVRFHQLEELEVFAKNYKAHLSANSLKGTPDMRFLTVRAYSGRVYFEQQVKNLKHRLQIRKTQLVKEEYEYCVFDSNKVLDKGWIDTPEITDQNYLNALAYEAFLRRASQSDAPFVLKGSFLTRQYLKNPNVRIPRDLDIVYIGKLEDETAVYNCFTDWVTKATEIDLNDGVVYKSFRENEFWRAIDYAMNDDFPTTNTDLECTVKGQQIQALSLDISWNLPVTKTVPLEYHPIQGKPFIIPHTVPLPMQISWKLHQSVVRPRGKDILDIVLLLNNNQLSEAEAQQVAQHYIEECQKDGFSPKRILHYTNGDLSEFVRINKEDILEHEKHYKDYNSPFGFKISLSLKLTNIENVFFLDAPYKDTVELLSDFEMALKAIGLDEKIEILE